MTTYGPINRTIGPLFNSHGQAIFQIERTWYRQAPRTAKPNPFFYRYYGTLDNSLTDCRTWGYPTDETRDPTLRGQVERKAWSRLVDGCNDAASLAVNIAEREQAFSMIAKRAGQLFRAARDLRKGRINSALKEFGVPSFPSAKKGGMWTSRGKAREALKPSKPGFSPRKKSKQFGDLWLEYHFGWEPLVKDIYSAVNILQSGFPPIRVVGKAKGSLTSQHNDGIFLTKQDYLLKVRLGAVILVDDPNLWQANQLGLTNPAVIAWELVPFSFVVDWFLPVGAFLSQYTDFVGLSLLDPVTTYSAYTYDYGLDLLNTGDPASLQVKTAYVVRRNLGINNPPLVRNKVTRLSPTRAATAISLLLQQLRGK